MAFKAVTVLLLAVATSSLALQQCERYEVYKECGSICEPKCGVDTPVACPAVCVSGCFCEEGLMRSPEGKCVPKEYCNGILRAFEQTCGVNEIYEECGSSCEKKCGEAAPMICTANCVSGCFCKEGYVKNEAGECIEKSFCESLLQIRETCGLNEEYQTCGTPCEKKCGQNQGDMLCVAMCVEGCFCKKGYVKNEAGECIEEAFCDTMLNNKEPEPVCGANEMYTTCGSACEPKCGEHEPIFCTDQCIMGCVCQAGYIKNEAGQCIEESFCEAMLNMEPTCGINEEYTTCGTACEPKCGEDMPFVCTDQCIMGCFCKKGYIKNEAGECIEESFCTSLKQNAEPVCGVNEIYETCGTSCERVCGESAPMICIANCVSGCFCKPGYIKNEVGECIEESFCEAMLKEETCGENEEYSTCGSRCEPTCDNPFGPWRCTDDCLRGCFCQQGFYRSENGCVKIYNC